VVKANIMSVGSDTNWNTPRGGWIC